MTVKEPLRGLSGGAALVSPTEGRRVGELARNLPYVLVVLSATVTCFVMFACLHWLPTFLMRSYSVTGETAGFLLGPLLGAVGAVSLLSSGYVTDQLSRRDFRWAFWLPGGCALLALPALAATFLADDLTVSLASFGVAYFGLMFFSAPTSAMIQFLAPLQLRARATAIYFLITTLVGFGVGPVVAGYASEFFASAGQESLRWALLSTTPVLILSPILLFAAAGRLPQWAREGGTPSASLAPASAR